MIDVTLKQSTLVGDELQLIGDAAEGTRDVPECLRLRNQRILIIAAAAVLQVEPIEKVAVEQAVLLKHHAPGYRGGRRRDLKA